MNLGMDTGTMIVSIIKYLQKIIEKFSEALMWDQGASCKGELVQYQRVRGQEAPGQRISKVLPSHSDTAHIPVYEGKNGYAYPGIFLDHHDEGA